MTDAERKILRALAGMCNQYLLHKGGLDHLCMSAGERAVEVLAEYGLVDCNDRGAAWTKAGQDLLDWD